MAKQSVKAVQSIVKTLHAVTLIPAFLLLISCIYYIVSYTHKLLDKYSHVFLISVTLKNKQQSMATKSSTICPW